MNKGRKLGGKRRKHEGAGVTQQGNNRGEEASKELRLEGRKLRMGGKNKGWRRRGNWLRKGGNEQEGNKQERKVVNEEGKPEETGGREKYRYEKTG